MKSLSEVLSQIEGIESEKDRVEFLKNMPRGYAQAARIVLKYMFDPKIKFRLPEGAPPYEESKADSPGILISEIGRLYIFTEGGHPTVTDKRLQVLFVDLLSTVMPSDAELLIAMKEKRSPYSGLSRSVVKKAFEGIFD